MQAIEFETIPRYKIIQVPDIVPNDLTIRVLLLWDSVEQLKVLNTDNKSDLLPYQNRFDKMRGSATIKWRTDELMQLLRGDD